jgi:hypothetical protein
MGAGAAFAQLGREVSGTFRGSTETHRHLRERIVVIVIVTAALDLVCGVLSWLLERNAPKTDIHGFGTGLFWTTSQLLTVSSSMQNPVTTGGRILDVLMEIYAITVVATLAGSFGAFFHRRSTERAGAEKHRPA